MPQSAAWSNRRYASSEPSHASKCGNGFADARVDWRSIHECGRSSRQHAGASSDARKTRHRGSVRRYRQPGTATSRCKGKGRAMETIVNLIIQLIAGVVGGNAAGAALKDYNLGNLGNTIARAIGGVGGGQLLQAIIRRSPARRPAVASISGPYWVKVSAAAAGGGAPRPSSVRVRRVR